MSEEREKGRREPAADDDEGGTAEASGPLAMPEGWPEDEWDKDDWDKKDWDKEDWGEADRNADWNKDGWPDELLPAPLSAEPSEGAAAESSRSPVSPAAEASPRPAQGAAGGSSGGSSSSPLSSQSGAPEESRAETTRRSSIAYAAGLTLFFTVVSFMGLGWLLDNWLGTRWLLVAGIVLGSVAGFAQFVRIITRLK
ncbi:MAG TPA: AtpZ/AtpI family protein [Pyrinomonadaceae bacterium]|nr:AtpZ/AtpI family protein [Pyrinomonadaceae bacterium]